MECNFYQLSIYDPFNTPLDQVFKNGVIYSYENGEDWEDFIRKYGTHYLDTSNLGGRISSK
jgi:hypothetical protein